MMFYAHTKTKSDGTLAPETEWQPLAEHLTNVAEQATAFAHPFGLTEEARLAGTVWHLVSIPRRP